MIFYGCPEGTQAGLALSGEAETFVGEPYSNLETMKLTSENFVRNQETGKLGRMQGNELNLKHWRAEQH